jgi:hypothetical protein
VALGYVRAVAASARLGAGGENEPEAFSLDSLRVLLGEQVGEEGKEEQQHQQQEEAPAAIPAGGPGAEAGADPALALELERVRAQAAVCVAAYSEAKLDAGAARTDARGLRAALRVASGELGKARRAAAVATDAFQFAGAAAGRRLDAEVSTARQHVDELVRALESVLEVVTYTPSDQAEGVPAVTAGAVVGTGTGTGAGSGMGTLLLMAREALAHGRHYMSLHSSHSNDLGLGFGQAGGAGAATATATVTTAATATATTTATATATAAAATATSDAEGVTSVGVDTIDPALQARLELDLSMCRAGGWVRVYTCTSSYN